MSEQTFLDRLVDDAMFNVGGEFTDDLNKARSLLQRTLERCDKMLAGPEKHWNQVAVKRIRDTLTKALAHDPFAPTILSLKDFTEVIDHAVSHASRQLDREPGAPTAGVTITAEVRVRAERSPARSDAAAAPRSEPSDVRVLASQLVGPSAAAFRCWRDDALVTGPGALTLTEIIAAFKADENERGVAVGASLFSDEIAALLRELPRVSLDTLSGVRILHGLQWKQGKNPRSTTP
jgi:hypothetical protein